VDKGKSGTAFVSASDRSKTLYTPSVKTKAEAPSGPVRGFDQERTVSLALYNYCMAF
jgi:hypothetical protein